MSEQEIVRYAFLDDFVRNSSHEELIEKLIELDEKHKKLKEEIYREKILKELYRDRLDKSIEYIENEKYIIGYEELEIGLMECEVYELLKILKGAKDD